MSSRKRPSLDDMDEAPVPQGRALTPKHEPEASATQKKLDPRRRAGKRAFTAYADARRLEELKVLATRNGTTIQELIERGMDYVFREHGLDKFVRKDAKLP